MRRGILWCRFGSPVICGTSWPICKEKAGLSLADLLHIGLDKAKPSVNDAYQRGFNDVLGECLVITEDCPVCYPNVCELIPDDAD